LDHCGSQKSCRAVDVPNTIEKMVKSSYSLLLLQHVLMLMWLLMWGRV
jgi:hypothetical protein